MVPDGRQAVLLAKKVCAGCPVQMRCYADAEDLSAAYGHDNPQGVWAGLTLQERNTWAGLRRTPAPCAECGLICVPVSHATDRCQACDPETPLAYRDYRDQILEMIAAGWTYQQVADQLRLSKSGVAGACYRWQEKARTSPRRGKRAVKECGTLAAKSRHARHGESWENCACKHVAWKRGTPQQQTHREVNVD